MNQSINRSDLWVDGQEIQPGVKVLSGPFHMSAITDEHRPVASCHASLCTLPPDSLQPLAAQDIVSDLEPAFTTTLAVECKQEQADIPLNIVLGHVRPSCNADCKDFEEAAENTATILADSWMCWVNGQSLSSTSPPISNATQISSAQTWKISEQNRELAAAGLDSSILSPFSEKISKFHEHEFVPSATLPLDPSSEEYHQTLLKALALDSPKYAHVNAEILQTFKQLIRKHPTAFLLLGSLLGQIQGFEHHIDTEDALPVYKHPYRKSLEELLAIKNELQRILKMKIIQPSRSE